MSKVSYTVTYKGDMPIEVRTFNQYGDRVAFKLNTVKSHNEVNDDVANYPRLFVNADGAYFSTVMPYDKFLEVYDAYNEAIGFKKVSQ